MLSAILLLPSLTLPVFSYGVFEMVIKKTKQTSNSDGIGSGKWK